MERTRAEISYRTVMQRNDEPRDVQDSHLPGAILAPDEEVLDVKVGDTRSDTNPLLIATDRRVLLTTRRAFGGWTVLQEAPASEVDDADYRSTLLSGQLSVRLRDGSSIALRTRTRAEAERFVAGIRHLLRG